MERRKEYEGISKQHLLQHNKRYGKYKTYNVYFGFTFVYDLEQKNTEN